MFEQPPRPPIRSTVDRGRARAAPAPRLRRRRDRAPRRRRARARRDPRRHLRPAGSSIACTRPARPSQPADAFRTQLEERLMAPVTRYARSGEASIAYQVVGDGPARPAVPARLDLADRAAVGGARACAASSSGSRCFGRLILFDSRGTGLSDRVARGVHARAGGPGRARRARRRRQRTRRAAHLRGSAGSSARSSPPITPSGSAR